MGLFSDVDWVIIVGVAVFLLFGRENREVLRTFGRWYARAGKMKQELLSEFWKAAELPAMGPGQALSLRGTLLGLDPTPTQRSGIPAPVRAPPVAPLTPSPAPPLVPTYAAGYPVPTWTMTVSSDVSTVETNR